MDQRASNKSQVLSREEFNRQIDRFNKMNYQDLEIELKLLPRDRYNEMRITMLKKLTYEYSSLDEFDKSSLKNFVKLSFGLGISGAITQMIVSSPLLKEKLNINVNKYFLGRMIKFKRGIFLFVPIAFYMTGEFIPMSFRIGLKHLFINDNLSRII